MLSNKEKQEMLKDAQNQNRKEDFRIAQKKDNSAISFDEYISFLNNIQKVFGPFKISRRPTPTKFNKL